MGILQNYIDNGSKYKSIKFGQDQPDGGSSKQPFMQKDINTTDPIQPGLIGFPSVVRGGIYSEVLAATDVARLTKYFLTPSGIQFIANQNLLSRLAPQTETSGKFVNEGVYTPLSTLSQAGVGNLGIHLNKQGLDPTGLTDFSIKSYGKVVSNLPQADNRLIGLTDTHIGMPFNTGPVLLDYKGGPGSILGFGRTKIKFATKADGETPLRIMGSNGKDPKSYLVQGRDKTISPFDSTFQNQIAALSTAQSGSVFAITSRVNGSGLYSPIQSGSFNPSNNSWIVNASSHRTIEFGDNRDWKQYQTPTSLPNSQSSTKLSIYDQTYKDNIAAQTTSSYKSQINARLNKYGREIVDETKYNPDIQTLSAYASGSNKPVGTYNSDKSLNVDRDAADAFPEKKYNLHKTGYLANLNKSKGYGVDSNGKIYLSPNLLGNHGIGPDFRTTSRNLRGFNDGHLLASYYDHTTDSSDYWTTNKNTLDHIYYTSDKKRTSTAFGSTTDLITFNIGIVNPDNAKLAAKTLTFRAYIDNLSDSYDADWSAQTYMGRGEKLYKYNSFGRTISLGFTVVAEGDHHLVDMYNHLNTLASSLAPSYVGNGYMAGNIHKLTIGNYINGQYGIITGLTYDIDNESPWEIDGSQLPHFIKVTGFKFTPIHNFRPEYVTGNAHDYINQSTPSPKKDVNTPAKPKTPAKTPAKSKYKAKSKKRRFINVKYPDIPRDVLDTYVFVTVGDRYDLLAQTYYGNESLWWIISRANPQLPSDTLYPRAGEQIRIPSVTRIPNIVSQFEFINEQQ